MSTDIVSFPFQYHFHFIACTCSPLPPSQHQLYNPALSFMPSALRAHLSPPISPSHSIPLSPPAPFSLLLPTMIRFDTPRSHVSYVHAHAPNPHALRSPQPPRRNHRRTLDRLPQRCQRQRPPQCA